MRNAELFFIPHSALRIPHFSQEEIMSSAPGGRSVLSWVLSIGIPLAVVAGVLWGVIELGGELRVVDEEGIRLPHDASAEGLPVFREPVKPPHSRPGTLWGDEKVHAAARAAKRAQQ